MRDSIFSLLLVQSTRLPFPDDIPCRAPKKSILVGTICMCGCRVVKESKRTKGEEDLSTNRVNVSLLLFLLFLPLFLFFLVFVSFCVISALGSFAFVSRKTSELINRFHSLSGNRDFQKFVSCSLNSVSWAVSWANFLTKGWCTHELLLNFKLMSRTKMCKS